MMKVAEVKEAIKALIEEVRAGVQRGRGAVNQGARSYL